LSESGQPVRGMLTVEELRALVGKEMIETVIVGFTDHYGRLAGKRYDAEMFLDDTISHGAHGCDYLLTTDMEMEPVRGYKFANWELGYGDFHLVPDMRTLRIASWLDKTALVLCDVQSEKADEPVSVAPRSILRKQLAAAQGLGFESYAASELEHVPDEQIEIDVELTERHFIDLSDRLHDSGMNGIVVQAWERESQRSSVRMLH